MREIRKIEKNSRRLSNGAVLPVAEQYSVGTKNDGFEVSDAKRLREIVDPKGERKGYTVCFTGNLDSIGKSVTYDPEEMSTISASISAEEIELAIQRTQDPAVFARMLTKRPWLNVWQMNMVTEDRFRNIVPGNKAKQ